MGKIALIVGGTGMAGNAVLPHLLNDTEDRYDCVICLARAVDETTFASRTPRKYISMPCNLDDKKAVVDGLIALGFPAITHVYWFADANRPPALGNAVLMRGLLAATDKLAPVIHGAVKVSPQFVRDGLYGTQARLAGSGRNARNQLWMGNVLDALTETGAPLETFVLGTGGKHYGMHLGPGLWADYSSPFYEEGMKCPDPLSYFDAMEFIQRRAALDGFSWNEVRPTFIVGSCPELTDATQSFAVALATFAVVLKAQGKKLRYPGTEGSYRAMINLCTSEKIAEVAAWSVGHPNQAFNCLSCPPFSWKQVWPDIARWFGMEPADPVRKVTGESSESAAGPQASSIWRGLRERNALVDNDFDALLNYSFLDKSFMVGYDTVFSPSKLREFGFPEDRIYEYGSGAECMTAFFDRLVEERIIPDPSTVIPGA
jgi:hypothetical protein